MTQTVVLERNSGPRWILIIAGVIIAVAGGIGAVVSGLSARYSSSALDIRGALEAEKGILTPHDFAATTFWIAVAAVGVVLLVVGLIVRAVRSRA